jgi:transcription antitermination factor NusG
MPYAKSLVSFGGDPPRVPDSFIQELQTKLEHIHKKVGAFFMDIQTGDPVSIKAVPFEGYEAIFDIRLDGSERVRILLKMLSDHYVPVELNAGQIEKQKKNSTH